MLGKGPITLLLLCFFPMTTEASKLVFDLPGERPVERYTHSVITKVYKDLGIEIRFINIPLARSTLWAEQGFIDGLSGRVANLSTNYKNLVRVNVPIVQFNIVMLVDTEQCGQCDGDSIRHLASVRGFEGYKQFLAENPQQRSPDSWLTSRHQVIELLEKSEIDAAVLAEAMIPQSLLDQRKSWRQFLLTRSETFHFLNSKHRALAPNVEKRLSQLQVNGWMSAEQKRHQLINQLHSNR